MLEKLSAQKVRNSDLGYTVQVKDRQYVEYIEAERSAQVEVDFGTTVGIYEDSLSEWSDGANLSPEEKVAIISRVDEALRFMGSETEIC